jgi:GH15 family glucan-1,4-alpha-glucosidase
MPDRVFEYPIGQEYKPISHYGIIGDLHTSALVGADGSIDWCCLPTFSSPSVFAAILDSRNGGRWAIHPEGRYHSTQEYVRDTNVLITEFQTEEGAAARLTDHMPIMAEEQPSSHKPEIHRLLECTSGSMEISFRFEPRLDYARGTTDIVAIGGGCQAYKDAEKVSLSSTASLDVSAGSADSELSLSRGERECFALRYLPASQVRLSLADEDRKLAETVDYWKRWAKACGYVGKWRETVIRSALALKLLIYHPTGAVVAAPTTSLPEWIGAERNWDYRYSWIRDSSFALWAFRRLGHMGEGRRYLEWLIGICNSCGTDLQVVYGINGERSLPEEELRHLEGYIGSSPVRIGNGAEKQFQLDIYGTVLDAIYFLHRHGQGLQKDMWGFVREVTDFVAENWKRPDNGIWEVRGEPRHHVYSKMWCWVALNRGAHLAKDLGFREDAERWTPIMDDVKQEVLDRGWSGTKRSFVQSYDSEELDAANLLMPLVGFIAVTDPRMISTIERTRAELSKDGLLYRYKSFDGLGGKEGAFALCSLWLVDNLAGLGRTAEAETLFEEILGYSNHLGLFSEEINPETGELLGNFPQAFTHLNIINSATNLDRSMAHKK